MAPTTNPASKAKKRRRAATVPGMVVTAATLGTTGLAFAYSVKTAPPTNTGKSAQAAAVAAEIAREKAGISQLHTTISSTQQQIKALQDGAQATTQPAASAPVPAPANSSNPNTPSTGATSGAGGSTLAAASHPSASAAAPTAPSGGAAATPAPSAAPAAAGQPVAAPAPSPAPAPAPTPTTTPTTQPAPPPPPPVTSTTGASGTA